ncbi:MAG TPA: hypothetical protein VMB52_05615 [Verrucomicrobiae bacterium]|nr:hypothetical protein [Verrucomicrobiae bacterium]
MKDTNQDAIREYYHSLKGIKSVFDEATASSHMADGHLVDEYEKFINDVNREMPNLLTPFNKQEFFSHSNGGRSSYYHSDGIRVHLARNLGTLKVRADNVSDTPATETKSFDFITNEELRKIIERDYQEIQRGIISGNWKSTIILSGGAIETILLDVVQKDSPAALASGKAPSETDFNKWDLNDLIEVSLDTKLVTSQVASLSHTVRSYRNLVHPGVELRKGLKIEPEEAKIALQVLNILIRDLS